MSAVYRFKTFGVENNKSAGFSLIEVAVAMLVLGLLLVPALKIMQNRDERDRLAAQTATISTVKEALARYVMQNQVYPMPANPTLAPGAAGFGKAVTTNLTGVPVCDPAVPTTTTSVCVICNPAGSPAASSAIKVCDDGRIKPISASLNDNRIVIGTVPFADLGLSQKDAVDVFNAQLTYAITYKLTLPRAGSPNTGFDDIHGVIKVEEQFCNTATATCNFQLTNPNTHYVLISSGPDRKGTFGNSGVRTSTCTPKDVLSAADTNPMDNENCDYDGTFVQMDAKGQVDNVSHYDDRVGWSNTMTSDIWSTQPAQPHIFSRNIEGRIGIGYLTGTTKEGGGTWTVAEAEQYVPRARIDVKGDIRADTFASDRFSWDGNGTYSSNNWKFSPVDIAGTYAQTAAANPPGIVCPIGRGMTGMRGNTSTGPDAECNNLGLKAADVTKLTSATCPVNEYPCGIKADGKLKCGIVGWTAGGCN